MVKTVPACSNIKSIPTLHTHLVCRPPATTGAAIMLVHHSTLHTHLVCRPPATPGSATRSHGCACELLCEWHSGPQSLVHHAHCRFRRKSLRRKGREQRPCFARHLLSRGHDRAACGCSSSAKTVRAQPRGHCPCGWLWLPRLAARFGRRGCRLYQQSVSLFGLTKAADSIDLSCRGLALRRIRRFASGDQRHAGRL